eukprot:ctg_71.g19
MSSHHAAHRLAVSAVGHGAYGGGVCRRGHDHLTYHDPGGDGDGGALTGYGLATLAAADATGVAGAAGGHRRAGTSAASVLLQHRGGDRRPVTRPAGSATPTSARGPAAGRGARGGVGHRHPIDVVCGGAVAARHRGHLRRGAVGAERRSGAHRRHCVRVGAGQSVRRRPEAMAHAWRCAVHVRSRHRDDHPSLSAVLSAGGHHRQHHQVGVVHDAIADGGGHPAELFIAGEFRRPVGQGQRAGGAEHAGGHVCRHRVVVRAGEQCARDVRFLRPVRVAVRLVQLLVAAGVADSHAEPAALPDRHAALLGLGRRGGVVGGGGQSGRERADTVAVGGRAPSAFRLPPRRRVPDAAGAGASHSAAAGMATRLVLRPATAIAATSKCSAGGPVFVGDATRHRHRVLGAAPGCGRAG